MWQAALLTASALAASAIRAGLARGSRSREGGRVEWQVAMVRRALVHGGLFAWMVPTVHLAGDRW